MLNATGTCRMFSACASHALRGRVLWVQGRNEGGSGAVAQAAYGSVHITRTECACYPASPAGYVSSCTVVCVLICAVVLCAFLPILLFPRMDAQRTVAGRAFSHAGIRSGGYEARKPMYFMYVCIE